MSIFYLTNTLQAAVSSFRWSDFLISLAFLLFIGILLYLVIKMVIQSFMRLSGKMKELEKRVVQLEEKENVSK